MHISPDNEPAYEMKVWSYAYAPLSYRAFFEIPHAETEAFIVYQRRIVQNWNLEWIAPNGTWWGLWHTEEVHELDEHARVYLLIESLRKS